jgi:heptosyltransferase-3
LELLVIRPGALGDTLMILPSLAALKDRAITHFAGREPGLGFISEAVFKTADLERGGWHRLFSDHPIVSPPLPVSKADMVLAFFKDPEGIIGKNLKRFFPMPEHGFFRLFRPNAPHTRGTISGGMPGIGGAPPKQS